MFFQQNQEALKALHDLGIENYQSLCLNRTLDSQNESNYIFDSRTSSKKGYLSTYLMNNLVNQSSADPPFPKDFAFEHPMRRTIQAEELDRPKTTLHDIRKLKRLYEDSKFDKKSDSRHYRATLKSSMSNNRYKTMRKSKSRNSPEVARS